MVSLGSETCVAQIAVIVLRPTLDAFGTRIFMIARVVRIGILACALLTATMSPTVRAQDVPGIEICTVEKTMERRTSCLQSNVDFLQKTITKLTTDHQQKLDAANRQIEALKAAVVSLQKVVGELQSAQNKAADDAKKAAAPAAKDAAPAAKDAAPAKDGAK
jgi:TolA-binding protein